MYPLVDMCPQQPESLLEKEQEHWSEVQSSLLDPKRSTQDGAESSLQFEVQSSVDQECGSQKQTETPCILLGELVGACKLKVNSHEEMQPYCIVKFGDRIIHRTLESTDVGGNRPIWTIETRSLFLLKMTSNDLTRTKLTINIWNKRRDALFATDASFLGEAQLDVDTILMHCNEERFEVKLDDDDGVVALRFRIATVADRSFVMARNRVLEDAWISRKVVRSMLNAEEEETRSHQLATIITETDETKVASKSIVHAVLHACQWQSFTEKDTGIQKIRSKPRPDPSRPNETEFMTHNDIKSETFRPSHNWVETGSGKLGTLHLEILACHGLPNVDTGEAMGNLTDAFVCAVFEGVMVQTPVIDDELSPHWLPWTQRAFRFGVLHPASLLYLGVFDYDLGIADHEAIGRVAINICNLQRDTTYTLKYNLHKSSNVTDRTSQGQITVRLRLQVHDEKAALMTALKPRPTIHVNVKKPKSFKVVRYTCFGEYDNEEKFDITVLRSYVNEMFEYKSNLSYCISDSFLSLMFWRGQVEIFKILVPVHSFLFFCSGCILVERPYMVPSFLLLGAAWVMLASMSRQRHHPSPWMRPQSFNHYMRILWTGESSLPLKRIAAEEGLEQTRAYDQAWEDRLAKDQKKRDEEYARIEALNDIGNDKIHTKTDGMLIPLDLLVRMARYQNIIGRICCKFRFFKMIMLWEESIVSFWITAGFLAAGLVSLLLPWAFILTWVGRMAVWGLFGPHMKFVDLFLQAQTDKHGDMDKALAKFKEQSFLARLRREEAVKLKAVKEIRFGRFSTEVPAFNLCRHYDRPLPQSSARIYHREEAHDIIKTANKQLWLPGQQLYGSMIPRPNNVSLRNQELAQKEMKRLLMLEARLAALRAAEANGGGLERIARRVSIIRRAEEPQASGHELLLLCQDESEVGQAMLSDLCIGPYQAEPKDTKSCFQQIMPQMSIVSEESEDEHSDHESCEQIPVLPALPACQYAPVFEEEGVEVVASGRLIAETEEEDEEVEEEDEEVEEEDEDVDSSVSLEDVESSVVLEDDKGSVHKVEPVCSLNEAAGTLSMLYKASDSTFVAFYRP